MKSVRCLLVVQTNRGKFMQTSGIGKHEGGIENGNSY